MPASPLNIIAVVSTSLASDPTLNSSHLALDASATGRYADPEPRTPQREGHTRKARSQCRGPSPPPLCRTPTHSMPRQTPNARAIATAVLAAIALSACSRATRTEPQPAAASQGELAAIEKARADSVRHPYTEADIRFMSGMIHHHAQAIVISQWAPSHDASASVRTLAARIINAQQDEIATLQQWLRDRRQPVPDVRSMKEMNGAERGMMMPGMLSEAQLKQLDAARGREFDRLFLTFMIQHHRGAVTMVNELFDSYGAAQDETVFKLASDINVDQTTEIARMERMLFVLSLGGTSH
jgi:uncharacterized protein (DUF305 family)